MTRSQSFIAVIACACVFVAGACKKHGSDTKGNTHGDTHGDTQGDTPEVDNTPVEHSDISSKPPKGCGGGFYSVHYGDAYKTLREAEDYKATARTYYVRELSDNRNEYFLAGISAKSRAEWLGGREKDTRCMGPIFDAIGAAAKRTLPKYRPRGYTHHEDDALLRDMAKHQIPDATVLESGVSSPSWKIEKLRNGVPRVRYKYGMAWVKSASFDDGYCRIVYVNVVQDYSGGGTFGESAGNFIKIEPAGCK